MKNAMKNFLSRTKLFAQTTYRFSMVFLFKGLYALLWRLDRWTSFRFETLDRTCWMLSDAIDAREDELLLDFQMNWEDTALKKRLDLEEPVPVTSIAHPEHQPTVFTCPSPHHDTMADLQDHPLTVEMEKQLAIPLRTLKAHMADCGFVPRTDFRREVLVEIDEDELAALAPKKTKRKAAKKTTKTKSKPKAKSKKRPAAKSKKATKGKRS